MKRLCADSDVFIESGRPGVAKRLGIDYRSLSSNNEKLIYMDEVGTPDSSRIWDGPQYRDGKVVENSKEGFRQLLLNHFPDPDILLNKDRMDERQARIVEMRVFGGFEVKDVAAALGISPATVKREWRVAKAWLHNELA